MLDIGLSANMLRLYPSEGPGYVQWTGERLAEYSSCTYSDLGHTTIRGSDFVTADIFTNNDINAVDRQINMDNVENDNSHTISHHRHHHHYSKFFFGNYNYGDELIADFSSGFESDLGSDL